jgi:hypothetical protein
MISMSNIWDRTAEFLSDNLGALLPIALLAIFVPTCITGNFAELRTGAESGLKLALSVASLAFQILSFWGGLVIMALALDPSSAKGAQGIATRRLLPAIGVMLVLLVAILLLTLPIWGILVASGYDFMAAAAGNPPPPPPGGASLALAIYTLVLVPLLLWISARLVVVTPAVLAERRGLGAIPRSFWLTRGVALKIVGVILLYAVVSFVATAAAQGAFGTIFKLVTSSNGVDDGLSLAGVLTSIVVAAVSTAFTVLSAAFSAKLFAALAARHEAAAPA